MGGRTIATVLIGCAEPHEIALACFMLTPLPENAITEIVIGKAMALHQALGPGLLEKTYEECLAHDLRLANLVVRQQVPFPLVYGKLVLADAYRIDLLVNDSVIVELKSVETITSLHAAQLLTYLRFSRKRVGLILNFNSVTLRTGLKRIVNLQGDISVHPEAPRTPITLPL